MSDLLDEAVRALNGRLSGRGYTGSALFVLSGEGSILINEGEARVGDGAAEVTMTASAETFRDILSGTLNPTSAFMSGRLALDGDMGAAMRLASALA